VVGAAKADGVGQAREFAGPCSLGKHDQSGTIGPFEAVVVLFIESGTAVVQPGLPGPGVVQRGLHEQAGRGDGVDRKRTGAAITTGERRGHLRGHGAEGRVGKETGIFGAHELVVDGELAELEGVRAVGPRLAVVEVENAPRIAGVDATDRVGRAGVVGNAHLLVLVFIAQHLRDERAVGWSAEAGEVHFEREIGEDIPEPPRAQTAIDGAPILAGDRKRRLYDRRGGVGHGRLVGLGRSAGRGREPKGEPDREAARRRLPFE